jgi:hypothetical protein
MKRLLILAFWLIASLGALAWTLFWLFGCVYWIVHAHGSAVVIVRWAVMLLPAAFGVILTRMGYAQFREEKTRHV